MPANNNAIRHEKKEEFGVGLYCMVACASLFVLPDAISSNGEWLVYILAG